MMVAGSGSAQEWDVTGYALGVATNSRESPILRGGSGFVGRFRLMPIASLGDAANA